MTPFIPTFRQAMEDLQRITLFLQTHSFSPAHQTAIDQIKDDLIMEMCKVTKQTKITDFLAPINI